MFAVVLKTTKLLTKPLNSPGFNHQAIWLVYSIVTDITKDANIDETNTRLMLRHANLE